MKNQQKTNSNQTPDFLLENIEDPELQNVISDVISYSEEYEIYLDEDINDWGY